MPLVPLAWNEQTLKWLDPIVRGELTMRQSFGREFFIYHTKKGFGISLPGGHSSNHPIARVRFDGGVGRNDDGSGHGGELRIMKMYDVTSPIVADMVVLLNLIDELSELTITTRGEPLMTVKEAAREVNIVAHEAQTHAKHGYHQGPKVTGRYRYRVLKPLKKDEWFHVTRASALPSIMRMGLVPSETMRSLQGEQGWTQWNLHLQNVVYLTADQDYAAAIAETLAGRFEEDAIVLQVTCPIDLKTVRLDEDVLRDEEGTMHRITRSRVPDFIESYASKTRSIGVARRIAPSCVKLVARLTAPVYEIDEERDRADLVGGLEWIEYE